MRHDEVVAAVREIARVHASFWENERLAELKWLPDHDQMWRQGYEEHWPGFEREYGVRLGPEAIALGERVLTNLEWIREQVAGRPSTMIHSDLRADNLLFGEPRTKDAVVLLDWQLVTRSMGAIDPTRLLGGSEPASQRNGHHLEVFTAWHEALLEHGVTGYEFEEALADFRLGALCNLMVPVRAHGSLSECTAVRLAAARCADRADVCVGCGVGRGLVVAGVSTVGKTKAASPFFGRGSSAPLATTNSIAPIIDRFFMNWIALLVAEQVGESAARPGQEIADQLAQFAPRPGGCPARSVGAGTLDQYRAMRKLGILLPAHSSGK